MALETKTPAALYRIGRKPDPWQAPDWSRASPDGTFGNRFDDPESFYRVLYASSQKLSCFVETLARFRPDLQLFAELQAIAGEDDFANASDIPSDWVTTRLLGSAAADGNYAEICGGEWIILLRRKLASDCLAIGIVDFDASVLQSRPSHHITQLASRVVYEMGLPGIYYRSRHGHNFENWALFEPFRIREMASFPIAIDDPYFLTAAQILGLNIRQA